MTLTVSWSGVDRARWEDLFAAAGRTSLTQSWAYGEAKAAVEGWRVHRAVVTDGGQPLALAQVLERRVGGLLRVGRLNRGPVWLTPPDPAALRDALSGIAAPWRWWRGGVFLTAPDLGADHLPMLSQLGFRRRAAPAWRSAWLDLSPEPDALRRRLNGKWRNMLSAAEKAGLSVEVLPGADGFQWLMERYRAEMAEKGFAGASPELLGALSRHAARPDDMLILAARAAGGEAVGGVLLARHGDAATYMVGWTGAEGRKSKAGNLMLWSAVLELRGRGCRWFDLGGIDDVLTPGIAAFKRGMNGEEYCLAGEFVRL